jgi:prepilin signal peptidase PulO-like enzyme (type II secretory pathway)
VELFGTLFFALLGATIGALLWVFSRVLAAGEMPAVQAPCPYCSGTFPSSVWIPVFGTIARCNACRRTLPQARFVLEFGLAISYVIAYHRIDSSLTLLEVVIFSLPIVVLLLTDVWTGAVFSNLAIAGIVVGLLFALFHGFDPLQDSLKGLIGGVMIFGAFMLGLRKILPSVHLAPLGWGDVLIAGMIGAMARWPGMLFTLFIGMALAGAGVALVIWLRGEDRGRVIPFGPFICAAAIPIFALTF